MSQENTEQAKTKYVNVRLTVDDKWNLKKIAVHKKITVSKLVREIINKYLSSKTI